MQKILGAGALLVACLLLFVPLSTAGEVDPELQSKADLYQEHLEQWHTPGLGALLSLEYTDQTRQEMACGRYQGDSTIWTGMYLASQAIRYIVTEDPDARAEVIRTAHYMHQLMEITQTPGYMGRFAGPNTDEFKCDCGDGHPWKVHGTGEWEGYYWIDHTSRDQYSGWWFGMAWAYDAVDDEQTRQTIREDCRAIMRMLEENEWNITDQNGEWTGNNAAWVGPVMRLAWILITAHVTDDPYYWELLEEQYVKNEPFLWVDTWSFINKYSEYYGNNLRHLAFGSIFRLWPDWDQAMNIWDIWQSANRPWVEGSLNPWFDAVHVTGCRRLGFCDPAELESIASDAERILRQYWDPPSYKREVTCSEQPLDPFSVWMNDLLNEYPWMREIIDVHPQTAQARELTDRHWTDMYWQSHGVFEASCHTSENQAFVGPGMDYLLAYYIGIYYGMLPGNGPFDDGGFADDDYDDDDDMWDDDESGDDNSGDDDAGEDDRDFDGERGCWP